MASEDAISANEVPRSIFGWALRRPWPFTMAYGTARTFLALAGALTLLSSSPDRLFALAVGLDRSPQCSGVAQISAYCVGRHHLQVTQWLIAVGLVVVASGWRPRVTGLFHWWAVWSFTTSVTLQDGGDQAATVLTLLLLPVTLLDGRRWHWQTQDRDPLSAPLRSAVGSLFLFVATFQVSAIYFDSSIAKLGQTNWVDGTAMYYWSHDSTFGFPGWAQPFTSSLMRTSIGTVAASWGPILLEFSLALAGLFGTKWVRHRLFFAGLIFHAGIAVLMGLGSFGMTMMGALVLLLIRPGELDPLRSRVLSSFARLRRAAQLDNELLGVEHPAAPLLDVT